MSLEAPSRAIWVWRALEIGYLSNSFRRNRQYNLKCNQYQRLITDPLGVPLTLVLAMRPMQLSLIKLDRLLGPKYHCRNSSSSHTPTRHPRHIPLNIRDTNPRLASINSHSHKDLHIQNALPTHRATIKPHCRRHQHRRKKPRIFSRLPSSSNFHPLPPQGQPLPSPQTPRKTPYSTPSRKLSPRLSTATLHNLTRQRNLSSHSPTPSRPPWLPCRPK